MKTVEEHTKNGKCEFGHLVIPDLTRITARGRSVRKELVTTLQILMAEGMQSIHTYNINIDFEEPLCIGLIACITHRDLVDHRSIWSKIGFLSRFIPFSFNYDEPLKADILRFINSDETLRKDLIKIRKRRMQDISIPDEIKPLLANDARRIAFSIEEFCRTPLVDRIFGARALHHISSYVKAIALRNGEKSVTGEHYESFKHLLNYFNFDCSLLLSEKPVSSGSGG